MHLGLFGGGSVVPDDTGWGLGVRSRGQVQRQVPASGPRSGSASGLVSRPAAARIDTSAAPTQTPRMTQRFRRGSHAKAMAVARASTASETPARATHGRASSSDRDKARRVPTPRARSRPPSVRASSLADEVSAESPTQGRVTIGGATRAVPPMAIRPQAMARAVRRSVIASIMVTLRRRRTGGTAEPFRRAAPRTRYRCSRILWKTPNSAPNGRF
jgi:hypothetical protein